VWFWVAQSKLGPSLSHSGPCPPLHLNKHASKRGTTSPPRGTPHDFQGGPGGEEASTAGSNDVKPGFVASTAMAAGPDGCMVGTGLSH
jgi:hypothetical protein